MEIQKITLSVWHDWQENKKNVSPKKEISTDQLLKIKEYIESIVSEQDRKHKDIDTKNIMAESNPNWIELYNFIAQLVNETFTEEPKITIFEPSKIILGQTPETKEETPPLQPIAPVNIPEKQPVILPIPKALKKVQDRAVEKKLQRQHPWSYINSLGLTGGAAMGGTAPVFTTKLFEYALTMPSVKHYLKTKLNYEPPILPSQSYSDVIRSAAKYVALGAAVGATAGGLNLLRHYIFQAPVGFEEQLKKLNGTNISPNTVKICGKDYLLARAFDNLDAAGYKDDWAYIQQHGYNQHYEIYFMPDDAHLVDLFLAIIMYLDESEVKNRIAFVALRPTPRLFNDYSLTGIVFRQQQVLPRIIICLKGSGGVPAHKLLTETLCTGIDALITSDERFKAMKSEGYQPWGSQKLTPFISVGFSSLNYKKEHPNEFKAPRSWRTLWLSNGDMAYPAAREKELRLTPPE